jgi:hypothetical protein
MPENDKKTYVYYMKWGEKWQKRSATVNLNYTNIPLLARLFGRRIYTADGEGNVKAETFAILYRGKVFIYGVIVTVIEEIDGPPRKDASDGQDKN